MSVRKNKNQEIDKSVQRQEISDPLVTLFAIYLPNPIIIGAWNETPTYTLTAQEYTDPLASSYQGTSLALEGLQPLQEQSGVGQLEPFKFKLKGNLYSFYPIPIEIEGLEYTAESAMPHPTITIGNIQLPGWDPESLLGARIQYIQTFKKQRGTDISLPIQTFIIDSIKEETFAFIQYELVAPYDLQDVKLPRRRIVGGQCPWLYKGASQVNYQSRSALIATDRPRGGCIWPADNVYTPPGGDPSLIFMNSNDEYIVDHRLIPLASRAYNARPQDVGVVDGEYYYTVDSSYKLDSLGVQERGLSVVYRYWQAIKTMEFDSVEDPSSDSNSWREVRVYKDYNYSNIYCAYTDRRFNDYVSLPQGGTQVNNAGLASLVEGYEFVEPETINEIISISQFSIVEDEVGGKALRATIDSASSLHSLALFISDPGYSSDDMRAYINTRENTGVGTFAEQPGETQKWLGLGSPMYELGDVLYSSKNIRGWGLSPGALVLVDETSLDVAYDSVKAGTDYSLWIGLGANTTEENLGLNGFLSPTGEFLSLWVHSYSDTTIRTKQIYQVKDRTLDPSKLTRNEHGPFPPNDALSFNFKNWTAGDQCSKTLNACVLRFQAVEVDAEKLKEGEETIAQKNNIWYMTPSYSGNDRNIYYLATQKGFYDEHHEEEGIETLANSPVLKYFRCDDEILYAKIPDEGYVTVEMYIDGAFRTHYPYYLHNRTGNDNYLDDTAYEFYTSGTTGINGALGHGLSPRMNLPDYETPTIPYSGGTRSGFGDFYYIKLASHEVSSGVFTPGFASFGLSTTASGRLPLYFAGADSIRSNGYDRTNNPGGEDYGDTWRDGNTGLPSDEVGLNGNTVPFVGNNGFLLYNLAGRSSAEDPFFVDRFGHITEIGLGLPADGHYINVTTPLNPIRSSSGHFGLQGNPGAWINNDWQQPVLRDKNNNAISNGTIDPVTGKTYRFSFSAFADAGSSPTSSTLNSNVALPFGGFPGSRRFK